MSLSINMICRNSADTIRRALESAKPLLDHPDLECELVVIDTGSVDDTIKIAGEYTDNVGSYTWDDSFARARNVALAVSRGNWILFLDADEEIPLESIPVIADIAKQDPRTMYISIVEQHGPNGEAHQHWSNTRMFPRKDAKWKFRVHEQVVYPEGPDHPKALIHPGLRMRHYGDVVNDAEKSKYYCELARRDFEDFPKSWHCMKQYAFSLLSSGGDLDMALALLFQVKNDMPKGPDQGVARTVYSAISNALKDQIVVVLKDALEKKCAGWWWAVDWANMMFMTEQPAACLEICQQVKDQPFDGFGSEWRMRNRIDLLEQWALSELEQDVKDTRTNGNGNIDCGRVGVA